MKRNRQTVNWWVMIYPSLPCWYDAIGVRVAGAGLGNCFYTYFHSVVMAQQNNQRIVAPSWGSLKIGPMLRGERSFRRYGRLLRAHPEEIQGFAKFVTLLARWPSRNRIIAGRPFDGIVSGGLTQVIGTPAGYTFEGLHPHREMIRQRLLDIRAKCDSIPAWGRGGYVAVHVRLGDFTPPDAKKLQSGKIEGIRLPLQWYKQVILRLREIMPNVPIYVFSDGRDDELADLLCGGEVSLRRGADDIDDLLAMAQASLLVGSRSTYSYWAAFLGNMPSIWAKADILPEKPSGHTTPILYVADDMTTIIPELVEMI